VGEKRGGEGGEGMRKGGREGRAKGKGRDGERRKRRGKGRGIWTPRCSRQIDATGILY
jgi:hypothetical protein